MNKARNRSIVYLMVSILGAALVWWGTMRGPGIGGDATIYLNSAKNFANGTGLGIFSADGSFRLIPYFPPFFPLLLSVFSLFHFDLLIAARVLNILLLAGTVFLVLQTSDEFIPDWRYILALGFLLILSPILNPVFSWAMSEPLSIFLGTLAILLALRAFLQQENRMLFLFSATLAGFSTLTRYGAIVYTAVVCLLLLVFLQGKFGRRFLQAVLYGLIAMIPVGIWSIIDILLTETVSSRSFNALDGLGVRIASFFMNLKAVILFWFVPDSWIQTPFYPDGINTGIVIVFIFLLSVACWFVLQKNKTDKKQFLFLFALVLFCVLYVSMTLVISLATYPPITIGTRMFSPMYLMAVWLVVALLYQLTKNTQNSWIKWGVMGLLFVFVLWNGFRGVRIVQDNHQTGLGFQSVAWQSSDLIRIINTLAEDQVIVSNEEMAILALTGRTVYPFAEIYFDDALPDFTRYGDGFILDDGQRQFKENGAFFILFDSIYSQLDGLYGGATPDRVKALTDNLEVIYQGQDGWIYRYRSSIEE